MTQKVGLRLSSALAGQAARQWSAVTVLKKRTLRMPTVWEVVCSLDCRHPLCARYREVLIYQGVECRSCGRELHAGEKITGWILGNGHGPDARHVECEPLDDLLPNVDDNDDGDEPEEDPLD